MSELAKSENWWQSFYEDVPCELLLRRQDLEALNQTVDFLCERLHLLPGMTVLDQCCGIGSLSLPLAKRGLQVTGVDLCQKHIRMCRAEADLQQSACNFHVADAFEFVAKIPCDAAFNWWTSFGYAQQDQQNLLMLRNALLSLKPGGWFALDYPNMARVIKEGNNTTQQYYTTGEGPVSITRVTSIDLASGLRKQTWTTRWASGRSASYDTSIRLYLPDALEKLFATAGFQSVQLLGGLHGQPLSLESQRCICMGQRPQQ